MANTITAPHASTARGLIGKYKLLNQLDLGPPETVFVAEELNTRRQVVLRFVEADATSWDGFFEEIRHLRRLEHEHIAAVLDAGAADGKCYLVSELLKGESLQERLKREHRLPLKEALRIAREMADALVFIHANRMIHRDLCPANVWIEPSGRVKLLGLGVYQSDPHGSLLSRLDESGTPGYLSPEQAAGEVVSPSADLFSLGCVLYQMATGERPFRGDNPAALFRAVIFEHPAAVRQINPDVPESLDDLITRLLAKMPSDRPASAQEVEHRLTEWLDPISPKPRNSKIPDALVYPASRRILDTFEALKNPMHELPAIKIAEAIKFAEPVKTKRGWFGDLVAALLLVGGAVGLYLWWKASR